MCSSCLYLCPGSLGLLTSLYITSLHCRCLCHLNVTPSIWWSGLCLANIYDPINWSIFKMPWDSVVMKSLSFQTLNKTSRQKPNILQTECSNTRCSFAETSLITNGTGWAGIIPQKQGFRLSVVIADISPAFQNQISACCQPNSNSCSPVLLASTHKCALLSHSKLLSTLIPAGGHDSHSR